MKVVIIEDEKLSADFLKTLLKRINQEIEIVEIIESVEDAVLFFNQSHKVDLVFVDIHLSDGNSFDIFNKVELEIPIIFTTAYDEYAIKAFKLNSIDYLLKPIGVTELKAAIEKFNKWNLPIEEMDINSKLSSKYKERFLVKHGDSLTLLYNSDISFFYSEDSYTFIYSNTGKKYIIDFRMDELESILNPKEFFRISRKTIIKIDSIDKVNTYFNNRLIINSNFLPEEGGIVSRERVSAFKKWLEG